MLIFAFSIYFISLPILWFHKYCTVQDVINKPPIFFPPWKYIVYSSARSIISWGSIVVIWLYGGPNLGILAGFVYFLVGTVALRLYYNRQIKIWLDVHLDIIRKESKLSSIQKLPPEKIQQALEMARYSVKRAMNWEY